jgi:Na+/proline symporter
MKLLLTLLKILAVSVPLTWLWIEWGRDAYGKLFVQLALPIYGLFGLTSLMPEAARDRFINYLPFLILMLITPRMTLRRRMVGIAVGFVVIFFVHVIFVYVASTSINPDNTINVRGFKRIVPANGLSDSVPFVLWVIIAREFVWESAARIFSSQQTDEAGPPG